MNYVVISKIVSAIFKVESGGVGSLHSMPLGDQGRALGPFQFHPEAFWDWCPKPNPGETWQSWFTRSMNGYVSAMFDAFPGIAPREIAVVFHQHCYIRRASQADFTADDYAERFDAAFA